MTPEPATPPGGEPRLSDEELEREFASHVGTNYGHPFPFCDQCGDEVPCAHRRMADELRALRADLKKAEAERKKEFDLGSGYHRQWMKAEARAEALREALGRAIEAMEENLEHEGRLSSFVIAVRDGRAALKDGQP